MLSFIKSLSLYEPFEYAPCPEIEFLTSSNIIQQKHGIYFKVADMSDNDEIQFLKFQIQSMDQHDKSVDEISACIKEHMRLLNKYNEIKDIGQILIAKIAEIKGCTSKDIYSEYGLDLED